MRKKSSVAYSILVVFLLIVITGCSLSGTIKELKMEPGVMDISIKMEKNTVSVDVILNSNVDITTTEDFAEKYALMVKKNYEK